MERSEHDGEISVSVQTLRCIGFLVAPCGDMLSDLMCYLIERKIFGLMQRNWEGRWRKRQTSDYVEIMIGWSMNLNGLRRERFWF